MKSDKERLAEAIHALNQLYEITNHVFNRYHFDRINRLKLEEALKQADKVLEGG